MRCLVFTSSVLAVATAAVLTRSPPLPLSRPAEFCVAARAATPLLLAAAPLSAVQLLRQSDVLEVLSGVEEASLADPGDARSRADVVSLNLVRRVDIDEESGGVSLELELPAEATSAGAGDRVAQRCDELLRAELTWVEDVRITIAMQQGAPPPAQLSPLRDLASTDATLADVSDDGTAAGADAAADAVPGVGQVAHIVAVASCKGGVGKSTTAVNLAYSLAARGLRVGIVDLDIHGPSLPTMAVPEGRLELAGEALLPLTAHGVKLMSMGFINPGVMPLRGAKVRARAPSACALLHSLQKGGPL